jgi:glucose/arabinose dehydrogenase
MTNDYTVQNNSDFRNDLVLAGLDQPIDMAMLPNQKVLILEKTGSIQLLDLSAEPSNAVEYLTLPNVASGQERGLTAITLDPDFESNGYFYVYYSKEEGNSSRFQISRFTHHDEHNHAHLQDELVVWQANERANDSYHFGGGLSFGPDGLLYLTTGDVFNRPQTAQDLTHSGGKIIRIDPAAADVHGPWVRGGDNSALIPDDNPFADGPGGNLDEIWAYGLRNPFRATWDLDWDLTTDNPEFATGRFFIGEVGGNVQSTAQEDIHIGIAGANYGWPNVEGISGNPLYSDPIFTYGHTTRTPNGGAIAGGFVYRGGDTQTQFEFPDTFDNSYFFADYVLGWIRYLKFDAAGNVIDADPSTTELDAFNFDESVITPVALKQGLDGALYYASIYTGELRRITFNSGNQAPTIEQVNADTTLVTASSPINFSSLATDPENDELTYLWDFGDGNQAHGRNVTHSYDDNGAYEVVLRVTDGNQSVVASPIDIIVGTPPSASILSPGNNALFRAGESIHISGDAFDPDGVLNDESYEWTVRFIHNDHFHPELTAVSGPDISFDIGTTGHDYSDHTGYEITLTVTDADGLSDTETVTIFPDKVDLSFGSNLPVNIVFTLDGLPRTGPFVHDTAINFEHTISVPETVFWDGNVYTFEGWSNSVTTATQTITVPEFDLALTASYGSSGEIPFITDGLVLHLEGDAGVTTDATGQVTAWSDQSGLGNDLVATGDPTLVTGGLNGHSIIEFDGSGDQLRRTLELHGLPAGNTNRSVFLVAKYDGTGYGGFSYGDNRGNQTFGAIVDPSGDLMVQAWGHTNDYSSNVQGTGAGWLVQGIVHESSQLSHYKDGVMIDSRNHTYNTDVANGDGLFIGSEIDSNPYVDMDVAAVLVYDRALSQVERQQVETYLHQKYFDSTPINQSPEAVADLLSTEENTEYLFSVNDLLSNDHLGDTPTTVTTIDGLSINGGTIDPSGTGSYVYTPAESFSGLDTFSYTITDADGETSTATVTVDVTAVVNQSPEAVADETTTLENTAVVITATELLSNDNLGDVPTTLTAVDAVSLQGGTITPNGADSYIYTPADGFTGLDHFTYTITDADGENSSASVEITVTDSDVDGLAVTDGLVLHLEGDAGVTTDATGQITAWSDQSGLGNDLVATGDPTLVTGGLNGHSIIEFDGSGDQLRRTLELHGLPAGNTNRSVFLVAKYDGTGYGGFSYGDNRGNQTFGAIVDPSGDLMVQAWGHTNDYSSNVQGTGAGWLVQGIVHESSQLSHYKDGVMIDSRNHTYNTDVANGDGLFIGSEIDSNPYVDMDVAAVLVYDRALSQVERQQVETYLHQKYFDSTPINQSPEAVADLLSTEENTEYLFSVNDLLSNDHLGDTPTTVTTIDGLSINGGTIDPSGTGSYVYTPAESFSGLDTFSYTITDADGETSTATVTVDVTAVVNQSPEAVADETTTLENTAVVITATELLSNDNLGDVPTTLTAVDAVSLQGGTITPNGAGSYIYTPADGFTGLDHFTYTITDADGENSTAAVTIDVAAASGQTSQTVDFDNYLIVTQNSKPNQLLVDLEGVLFRFDASPAEGDAPHFHQMGAPSFLTQHNAGGNGDNIHFQLGRYDGQSFTFHGFDYSSGSVLWHGPNPER